MCEWVERRLISKFLNGTDDTQIFGETERMQSHMSIGIILIITYYGELYIIDIQITSLFIFNILFSTKIYD